MPEDVTQPAIDASGGDYTFVALPRWLAFKVNSFELHVLFALQYHHPRIYPSLNRLASMTNLSRRKVMTVLADLERKGWIDRHRSKQEDGQNAPTVYTLRVWNGDPGDAGNMAGHSTHGASGALPVGHEVPHLGHEVPCGRAQDDRGVGHRTTGGRAHGAPEEYQLNKNKKKDLEPTALRAYARETGDPCPDQVRGQASEPTAATDVEVQTPPPIGTGVQSDTKPNRSKAAKQRFDPTLEDIPADLLGVAHEIIDFWAEKQGSHTIRAWNGLLGELRKIHQDPAGGTETLRNQLNTGIQSGKWNSCTHANWKSFAGKALPFTNGSKPRSRVQPKAEFMAEFLQAHTQNTLRTI